MEKYLKYLLCLCGFIYSSGTHAQDTSAVAEEPLSEWVRQDVFWKDTLNNDNFNGTELHFPRLSVEDTIIAPENFMPGTKIPGRPGIWRYILLLCILAGIGLSRVVFPGILVKYTRAFGRTRFLDELLSEFDSEVSGYEIWLVLVSSLMYALPLQLLAGIFEISISDYPWGDYIFISLGLFTLFIFKYFVQTAVGRIIEARIFSASLIFSSSLIHFFGSLVLLALFLIILANSLVPDKSAVAVLMGSFIVFSILLKLVRSIFQVSTGLHTPLFYIILYLCALEIAPWLFIFKLLEINLN